LNEQGRVVILRAYADWTNQKPELVDKLYRRGVELIQIPNPSKNSIDMKMITDAMDILSRYQNIDHYLLITGDFDFRPLMSFIRQRGKRITLICDVRSMSQDLVDMADYWHDVTSLKATVTDVEAEAIVETLELVEAPATLDEQKLAAFTLLQEAVEVLQNAGNLAGIGMTKNVMMVHNPGFNERDLSYIRFANFVADAEEAGYICTAGALPATILTLPGDLTQITERTKKLDESFILLSQTVRELESEGKSTDPATLLKTIKESHQEFSFTGLGYNTFISFLRAAEQREIIGLERDLRDSITAYSQVSVKSVEEWLNKNISLFYGERARMPEPLFIEKIADVLDTNGMSLEELEMVFSDKTANETYEAILDYNGVGFLPPYQKSLFFILLGQQRDLEVIIAEVNTELRLLGFKLYYPES
jgi:hypothetical protein